MPGNHFVIFLLLVWPFVGRGIFEGKVKGVLHGRLELHTCHEPQQNVNLVEWSTYRNSLKLLYLFDQKNDTSCSFTSCNNIQFNVNNKSLIFVNLTKEDEAVYLNRIVYANGTAVLCNITLSVLSPPAAVRIAVSTTNCTLTLRCAVRGEFQTLSWLRDGLLIPDDQRINISERNMTVHVSNLTSSDRGMYTCGVSNEAGTSEAHVNITDENTTCQDSTGKLPFSPFHYFTGLAVIPVIVCIILICICRKGRRKAKDIAMEEPVYDEPNCTQIQESSFDQEEPDAARVNPLPYVYSDFIQPKAQLKEKQQDEEAGYSTIAEMQIHMQPLQTPTSSKKSSGSISPVLEWTEESLQLSDDS